VRLPSGSITAEVVGFTEQGLVRCMWQVGARFYLGSFAENTLDAADSDEAPKPKPESSH
jgi:uncharacterized protein YodC (DUF2158 family)